VSGKSFTQEFFKKQGRIGGKKAAAALTPEQRQEKASKADGLSRQSKPWPALREP
jgi:hypothetical protein